MKYIYVNVMNHSDMQLCNNASDILALSHQLVITSCNIATRSSNHN